MSKHFTCSWCGRSMLLSNKSRHLSTCLYKNELKSTKDYILKLIEDNPDERVSLRIGTIASLNIQNFDFYLLDDNNRLALSYTKLKTTIFKVDENLQQEIRNFLREIDLNDEDYIFYRGGRNLTIRRRSQALSIRINERIRKSKVFRQSANFKYSSHMI